MPPTAHPHRPRKWLGQHFLDDVRILDRIAAALDPQPDDIVLEIGPGAGSLTDRLLAHGGRVVAIEKDTSLAARCAARIADRAPDRCAIVVGDALALDWHALVSPSAPASPPRWKVAGNIPYRITSPLIAKALVPPWPERIVFLVQAEVAHRLAAPPGSAAYGALSVGVQAVCRVERLFAVKAGAFRPPPRVDSAVVRLTPLATPVVAAAEHAAFRAFVTACFARRRKQLRNVLAGVWGCAPAAAADALRAAGLDPAARPETLAPAAFASLLRRAIRL